MPDDQPTDLYIKPHFVGDLSLVKIFTEPPVNAGPVNLRISTGISVRIFIHISVYLITKFKIFTCTKLEKLITLITFTD